MPTLKSFGGRKASSARAATRTKSRGSRRAGSSTVTRCRYQFSVRVGTLFHDSKLPLWKWFLAVYMMGESKKGVSANQLKRMLGVSYKTAWYLCHRIRAAMHDECAPLLRGIVEADETYVGGKLRPAPTTASAKPAASARQQDHRSRCGRARGQGQAPRGP